MGDEAEKLETETPEVDETKAPEEGEEESTKDVVEVYLEGEDETPEGKQKTTEQDRINAAVQKRVAREKRKQVEANELATKQVQDNAILLEQNKLLELRNQQLQQGNQLNPDDFDQGASDPKYIAALVQQQVAAQQPTLQPAHATEVKDNTEAIRAHVTAAMSSGLSDFEENEDKVIEEIGSEAHNYIVDNFPGRSHLVTYALAKNPGKLAELGNHVRSGNNQKALLLLGEISATAKVRKVSKSDTPDPVDEVEGSVNSTSPWQAKHDKLVEKVQAGKASMRDLLNLKKQAAEKGVTL